MKMILSIKMMLIAVLVVSFPLVKNAFCLHSDTIDVIHYKIDIGIYRFSTGEISGSTTLKIVPKINQTTRFCLDLFKLTVDSVQWNGQVFTSYTYNDTLLIFNTEQPINMADTFYLQVFYHGKPKKDPSNWGGFYFYDNYAWNLGVGMASDPHVVGRFWFPCMDDFVDRASYDFFVTVKPEHKAVCNGLLQEISPAAEGRHTFHWKLTEEIPTYLACVAVGDFVALRDTFNGMQQNIPIEIWVPPSDSSAGVSAFSNLKNILIGFEQSFGPYRWERVGYVAVPFDGGAMEHATCITFPRSSLSASQSAQLLIAHELSHHWFGNLITCSSEQEMWINEGWASFCEVVFLEKIYGQQTAMNYVKSNHKKVLTTAHVDDNGYWALSALPHDYTYGTHAYDKGSDVVTSLRYHMGDSMFFSAITGLLQYYAFQPVTSIQLCNYLSASSGMDLTGFFNAMVFSPGFYHFSIDSFNVDLTGKQWLITVYLKQKIRFASNFAQNLHLELAFLSVSGELYKSNVTVGGAACYAQVAVPFHPVSVIIDPDQHFCDAILNEYRTITNTGMFDFNNASFVLYANTLPDTCFVHAAFSYVPPDSFMIPVSSLRITDYAYWTIDANFPAGFSGKGKFYYNSRINSGPVVTTDSLILLYRRNAGENWRRIQAIKSGNYISGSLTTVNFIEPGQYAVGLYDYHSAVVNPYDKNYFEIFPNPAGKSFEIKYQVADPEKIVISDIFGKTIKEINLDMPSGNVQVDFSMVQNGVYMLTLLGKKQVYKTKLMKW